MSRIIEISKSWNKASVDELSDELDRILNTDLTEFPCSEEDVRKAIWVHELLEAAKTPEKLGHELFLHDDELDVIEKHVNELQGSRKRNILFSLMQTFGGVKATSYLPLQWLRFIPTHGILADSFLLLVCKPDDAESAAGDLLEQLEKVQGRHGKWYCNFWFFWELSLLVMVKGRKRLTKSVLGPIVDLWKRKSG